MKGTKRFGVSDSNTLINDSSFQSKRLMVGSQFDIHRAEPSRLQSMETPRLDVKRADSSRQHVRALNTQFASWVQTQLQNHPDELWEDGAQDYLTHASNIMEKFSDVVSWLKANAAKAENQIPPGFSTTQNKFVLESKDNETKSSPEKTSIAQNVTSGSAATSWGSGGLFNNQVTQKKFVLESKDNETKSSPEKSSVAQNVTSASAATSWGSGGLFNNQVPFSFGGQSLIPLKHDASKDSSKDVDGVITEDDVEQPSSPSVKKTEEKGVIIVHEVKCKLYVKSSDPTDKDAWKDKGTGQLSIKCKEGVSKGTKDSKPTILVRNDVGRLLLNALLYPGIKTNMQKNSIVAIFHTAGEGGTDGGNDSVVARTFLIRTKNEDDRNKLAAVIQEYAPAV